MAITLDRQGARVYLTGDTYAVKDRIKRIGGHWDGDRRAWWVGAAKMAAAEQLVRELAGEAATAVGLATDAMPEAVADKTEEAAIPKPKQDPDDIRLTGKGEYKGRTYYLGSRTKDGQRIRCLTLPDAKGDYLDFWVQLSLVKVIKTYQPREVWDGRYCSGRTRTEYTTLGSIAKFIARQRNPNTARGQCTECGHFGPKGQSCSECGGEGHHA